MFATVWKIFTEDMTPLQRRIMVQTIIAGLFAFHIAWACGWLPGISGFALASDTQQVQEDIKDLRQTIENGFKEIRKEQIQDRLSALQALRCTAQDQQLEREYVNRIQELQSRYRDAFGYTYPLEPCAR